jgi:hypothetical protein
VHLDELRRLVERKTEIVKMLESLLEEEEAELVELERQLESHEDDGAGQGWP